MSTSRACHGTSPGDSCCETAHLLTVERSSRASRTSTVPAIPAVHGVELEQVGCGSCVGVRVVHMDEFEVVAEFAAVSEPTDDEPADPSEPVDADSNGHDRER